jgi:hypothetical protein
MQKPIDRNHGLIIQATSGILDDGKAAQGTREIPISVTPYARILHPCTETKSCHHNQY